MRSGTLVIDPFAGSGNMLHWMLRGLPGARGLGFELDERVFALTQQNIAALNLPITILNTGYRSGLTGVSATPDELLIAFIAPPWGDALDPLTGLDLRLTTPPVPQIVDVLFDSFPKNLWLFAIQMYEVMHTASLVDLQKRFEWWAVNLYRLNAPDRNHGVLLGTTRWAP
jgi:hypothetical protein